MTTLAKEDCYSAECPKWIKGQLVGTFIGFYILQALMLALFKVKSRKLAVGIYGFISFCYVPALLVWNIWGNSLIERMDGNLAC